MWFLDTPIPFPFPFRFPVPRQILGSLDPVATSFVTLPLAGKPRATPYHHPWPNLNSHEVAFIFIQFDNNPKDLSPGICPMDWEEVALLSSCSGWPQWSI